jgi:aldose 1-epimerase
MDWLSSPAFITLLSLVIGGFLAFFAQRTPGSAHRRVFGQVNGQDVHTLRLTNATGMSIEVCEFGATLTSVKVPRKDGEVSEVTLGHHHFNGYLHQNPFLGCTAGRYANRIADGQFSIDGQSYQLAKNNNGQHLHGGIEGLDRRLWKATYVRREDAGCIHLTYRSPAGEENYPGNLDLSVTFTLPDHQNAVYIQFQGQTDAPTICNLTNHAFFNLAGRDSILDHRMQIFADRFIPISEKLIPTGERQPVEGTPFDFRQPKRIGERIGANDTQLQRARGYDHCYDLGPTQYQEPLHQPVLRLAARVSEPTSGRWLEVLTDAPGIQFYSGNFLDGTVQGRWKKPFGFRQGLCLEPGLFPDSPNQTNFHRDDYPSGVLRPQEKYAMTMVYRFGLSVA